MKKAGYRFQEMYTGVQIIVWNKPDEISAESELSQVVRLPGNWIWLGTVNSELFNKSTEEI
jgi:hypothetical protein